MHRDFRKTRNYRERINADCDSWLTSTTMKTYNSNAERGERMRHWPLEKWETRPLAAGCRHLLQQDDCSNNWNGIQDVMNAGKVTWISGKCRISKEQILIITFGSPRRQAGDLQCNAEKGNVGWDISHWREEIEAAQLQNAGTYFRRSRQCR